MYQASTHGIDVKVLPFYVPEQSDPESGRYLFGYHVTITNEGTAAAKLLRRHWIITDGHSHVEEVRGEGVVGEQPLLQPGASFEYTSACPLPTPTGNMRGSYHLVDEQGRELVVRIPLFFLRPDVVIH